MMRDSRRPWCCLAITLSVAAALPAAAQVTRSQNSNASSYDQPASDTAAPATAGLPGPGTSSPAKPAQPIQATRDGLAWRNDRLTLSLADGNFTISPLVRIDVDEANFSDQAHAGGFQSGTDFRRERLGVRGTFLKDFEYNFTWEFGSRPSTPNTIFEAQVGWNALDWATVRVGAFSLQHMPEFAESSYDLLFLERAAITNIVTSLSSGDTREAVGLEARGALWNASFYVSGAAASARNTSQQRGLVGRAVGLAVNQPGLQLQLGFDAAAQFAPGSNTGAAVLRLRDYPELRGSIATRLLDTGNIPTDTAWAIGPEAEARLGPVYLEAVYQHVGLDVTGGGHRSFDGWYVEGAVPLLGPARERVRNIGTWARPKTIGWNNPLAGNWGAIEAAARYSAVDLNDGSTRGGRQRIWTTGVNWYFSPNFKIQAEYENGHVDLDAKDRPFQAIGLRAALSL